MEEKNKFFVYDSFVFAFKNILAQVRVFTLIGLITVLVFVCLMVVMIVSGGVLMHTIRMAATDWRTVAMVVLSQVKYALGAALIFLGLAGLFVSWISVGFNGVALGIRDEGEGKVGKFFPSVLTLIKAAAAMICFVFVLIFGFICLIVPGIYWLIRSNFFMFAIIDGAGVFEAFSISFRITKGKEWYILGHLLIVVALSTLPIITLPISALSGAYIYRYLLQESKQ